MREVFDLLFRIQKRHNLHLMIIGGWALQAHGFARNTLDVDCLAALDDAAGTSDALEKAGFHCFDEMKAFRRFRHRVDPMLILDVMTVNTATFARMWEASVPLEIAGHTHRVPCLAHLISLKLHAAQNEHRTEKDIGDIIQLLSSNPDSIAPAELHQLCDKFGTPALAARLHEFL